MMFPFSVRRLDSYIIEWYDNLQLLSTTFLNDLVKHEPQSCQVPVDPFPHFFASDCFVRQQGSCIHTLRSLSFHMSIFMIFAVFFSSHVYMFTMLAIFLLHTR